MAATIQVRALYDFDAQPGTGELSIVAQETLTVTRQDVGEGWWEGYNSKGDSGLFPAGYVEVISTSPPPVIPPPPLPEGYAQSPTDSQTGQYQYQQGYAVDDFDDDWDDDDSTYGQELSTHGQVPGPEVAGIPSGHDVVGSNKGTDNVSRGTVRKNFNRFSTFVKTGFEDFILGVSKGPVPAGSYVQILDSGAEIIWAPDPNPYTCVVASPKKESKLKGLKSFIAYRITPSFTNIQVSRRYKHFDWLHERLIEKFTLIPIPPLPDKQISGRYQDDFIEHRMAQLQLWVNRICRHPILSQCNVWKHFLSCTDEKKWKMGKRQSEKDELVGAAFLWTVQTPSTPLDYNTVEKQTENFGKFAIKMDESVNKLFAATQDQSKKWSAIYKREFQRIGIAFREISAAFEMEPTPYSTELTKAIRRTGDTYEDIGKMHDEQPKYDFEPMGDMLHEYKGMLAAWPDILQMHRGASNKRKEYQKLLDESRLEGDKMQTVTKQSDVVSYSTLAEISHFHRERVADYKYMMQSFLTAQINFYQKIVEKLQESLTVYDHV